MNSSIIFKQCWFCSHWIQSQQIICISCATNLNIFHNPSLPFNHIHVLSQSSHHAWINYLKFSPKAKPLIVTISRLLIRKRCRLNLNQQHNISNEQLFIKACRELSNHEHSNISLLSYDKKEYCQDHLCYAYITTD